MLPSWGISTADYVLYTLVSGTLNVFTRPGLPVLALLVMVTVTRPGAGVIAAVAAGLAILGAATAGIGLPLRSESFALRADRVLQGTAVVAFRLARRQLRPDVAGWLLGFRGRAAALLALWLVLIACLRGVGLSQAQVARQTSLAAFAFVRLLTVLPVTPRRSRDH